MARHLTDKDRAELVRIRADHWEPRFNRILANEILAQYGDWLPDLDAVEPAPQCETRCGSDETCEHPIIFGKGIQ